MTVNIKGKEYVTVAERMKTFRQNYPNYSLLSDLVRLTDECCVIKATILDENGREIATGYAQEDRSSSNINKTSYVENCESSAWDRVLGNFLAKDLEIATAEEVVNAVINQNPEQFSDKPSEKQISYLKTLLGKVGYTEEEYLASYGVTAFEEMDKKDISLDINKLKIKVQK